MRPPWGCRQQEGQVWKALNETDCSRNYNNGTMSRLKFLDMTYYILSKGTGAYAEVSLLDGYSPDGPSQDWRSMQFDGETRALQKRNGLFSERGFAGNFRRSATAAPGVCTGFGVLQVSFRPGAVAER